jgi:hypothetical protein
MIILRKNEDIRYFHIKLIHIHGRKLKMRKLYKNQANKIKRMENTEVDELYDKYTFLSFK